LALVLVAPGLGTALAQAPVAVTTGKVLLLDNERVVEGEITRVGDRYSVKRFGGETSWPAEKVLRLCANMEDAYNFLRTRANLKDPDERLRLAQWCHLHGLREQALNEVSASAKLQPNNEKSERLLQFLKKDSQPAVASASDKAKENVKNAAHELEVSADSFSVFATKVQPILMNACAKCHTGKDAGQFQIDRSAENVVAGRRTLQQNLTAVLAQVNLEQPRNSPFLEKAVSVHGNMERAPLSGKHQMAAYRTLEDWVRLTLSSNPKGHDVPLEAVLPAPKEKADFASEKNESKDRGEPSDLPRAGKKSTRQASALEKTEKSAKTQPKSGQSTDPYDPEVFNKLAHPEEKDTSKQSSEGGKQ
jgi:hypothetical protein